MNGKRVFHVCMYTVYEYARNYLYKPVPKSGLGLASPTRLGASPLATQKINETSMKNHQTIIKDL